MLRQIGGGNDDFGHRDAVVGAHEDAEFVCHRRVVVDNFGDVVDEFDVEFGGGVAGGCFSAEEDDARDAVGVGVGLEFAIEVDDVEQIQELALVFVDALDLNVEEHVAGDVEGEVFFDEALFVFLFDGNEAVEDGIVVGECFEFFEIFAVRNPRIADFFAQKVGETGVCRDHPTTRRDAVRLVVEALGEELDEIGEEVGFDEVGVDLRDAVDGVRSDDG